VEKPSPLQNKTGLFGSLFRSPRTHRRVPHCRPAIQRSAEFCVLLGTKEQSLALSPHSKVRVIDALVG
jgi:hypothetical protein